MDGWWAIYKKGGLETGLCRGNNRTLSGHVSLEMHLPSACKSWGKCDRRRYTFKSHQNVYVKFDANDVKPVRLKEPFSVYG